MAHGSLPEGMGNIVMGNIVMGSMMGHIMMGNSIMFPLGPLS